MNNKNRIRSRINLLRTEKEGKIRKLKSNSLNPFEGGRVAGEIKWIDKQIKFLKTLQNNESTEIS